MVAESDKVLGDLAEGNAGRRLYVRRPEPAPDGHDAERIRCAAAGNRVREWATDAVTQAVLNNKVGCFDSVNRLLSLTNNDPNRAATFGYDNDGNTTSKTVNGVTTSYAYDVRDRQIQVSQGGTILGSYDYDADGRLRMQNDEGVKYYVYDQTSRLQEMDANGNGIGKYDYGSKLIRLSLAGEGQRYYSYDGLGSATALTDETGFPKVSLHLDAWGVFRKPSELDNTQSRVGFTGYFWSKPTSLYFAKARWYDPETARFTTQDSFLGKVDNPPSLHRYFYANNNPTRYIDLTGHWGLPTVEEVKSRVALAWENTKADARTFPAEFEEFKKGAYNAYAANATLGAGRIEKGGRSFKIGQATADMASIASGYGEGFGGQLLINASADVAGLGGFEAAATAEGVVTAAPGVGAVVAGGAGIVTGAGLVAHGTLTVAQGAANFMSDVKGAINGNVVESTPTNGSAKQGSNTQPPGGESKQNPKVGDWEAVDVNGRRVYQNDNLFDPDRVSSWKENGKTVTGTNVERMQSGRAPIGYDGESVELHHLTQSEVDAFADKRGALAEVGGEFHSENTSTLHIPAERNPNNPSQTLPRYPSFRRDNFGNATDQSREFVQYQREYWIERGNGLAGDGE
jgi:RHS repeat-associated protein